MSTYYPKNSRLGRGVIVYTGLSCIHGSTADHTIHISMLKPHFVSEFQFLAHAFCWSPLIFPICMHLILNTQCSANSSTVPNIRHIILVKEQWKFLRTCHISDQKWCHLKCQMEFFNKMATSVKFSAINLHFSLIFHNYNGWGNTVSQNSEETVWTTYAVRVGLSICAHVTKIY